MLRHMVVFADNMDDSDPKGMLINLWKLVLILQRSRCLQQWGPTLAATPGLLLNINQLFKAPHLPQAVAQHFVQHVGVRMRNQQLILLAQ